MPKGYPVAGPRQTCRKGHPFTQANTIYEPSGVRRCFMCRENSKFARLRRHHRPHPSDSGVCGKGLHAWTPDNVVTDSEGHSRCKPCRETTYKLNYARCKVILCVVKNCPRATHRPDGNYVCKNHRKNPPDWFAKLGFVIVGTQIVQKDQPPQPPEPPPPPPVTRPRHLLAGTCPACGKLHLNWREVAYDLAVVSPR